MAFDPSKYVDANGNPTDTSLVQFAQALRDHESGGNFDASGKSGEHGAYQWMPGNYEAAAKQFGVDPNDRSPTAQNKVAYMQMAQMKDQGLQPYQIASKWNSGSPDNWDNAHVGTNSKGVKYDTPGYVKSVMDKYTAIRGGAQSTGVTAGPNAPVPAAPTPDQQSAQETGAFFPASSSDSGMTAGLKAAGNMIPSAFNFAKGALNSVNPLAIASTIGQIPGAFNEAVSAHGGNVGSTIIDTITGLPKAAYQTLVPKAAQQLFSGDVAGAGRTVTNDPFGSVAPFVFGAKALAEGVDSFTGNRAAANMSDYVQNPERMAAGEAIPTRTGTNLGGAFDAGISKIASPVTGAARAFSNFVSDKVAPTVGATGRYIFGQATGLEPSTIETRIKNPGVDMSTLNRTSLGETIGGALDDKIANLKDTGTNYDAIRQDTTPVTVDPNFLRNAIEQATGLTLKKGSWAADTASGLRDAGDVAKVQRLYDFWQKSFKSGQMSTTEFLNLRADLADMAKYDSGFGKSQPLDRAAQGIRSTLNDEYRPQINGLGDVADEAGNVTKVGVDTNYAKDLTELQNLRKGLLDKNNNLTDGAINKIANALGKGKDSLIERLEQISPGISKQIQLVKMAEDFERAAGNKVGTYARAGLGSAGLTGGIITGNIPLIAASIAEMVLQTPTVADAVIRTYGASKPLMTAIAKHIRTAAKAVNSAPSTLSAPINTSVFGGSAQPALPAGR